MESSDSGREPEPQRYPVVLHDQAHDLAPVDEQPIRASWDTFKTKEIRYAYDEQGYIKIGGWLKAILSILSLIMVSFAYGGVLYFSAETGFIDLPQWETTSTPWVVFTIPVGFAATIVWLWGLYQLKRVSYRVKNPLHKLIASVVLGIFLVTGSILTGDAELHGLVGILFCVICIAYLLKSERVAATIASYPTKPEELSILRAIEKEKRKVPHRYNSRGYIRIYGPKEHWRSTFLVNYLQWVALCSLIHGLMLVFVLTRDLGWHIKTTLWVASITILYVWGYAGFVIVRLRHIKPHYAIALGTPLLVLFWMTRSRIYDVLTIGDNIFTLVGVLSVMMAILVWQGHMVYYFLTSQRVKDTLASRPGNQR